MYAKDFHFFADVLDAHEMHWLRHDGLVADGVAQCIAPPSGAVRCHGRRFYPTLAVYVKQ